MPPQNRIHHVVVLMLENRSFDHIFGFADSSVGQEIENLNDGTFSNLLDPSKPESATNPRIFAKQTAPFAVQADPSHSFNATNIQLCNNRPGPTLAHPIENNGFVRSYRNKLIQTNQSVALNVVAEVLTSFSPEQLPAINALAENFCLCDHWFCEVPGPTMPNRMFIHAATSEGYVHNAFDREYASKTIYELFQDAGLDWCVYFHDLNEVWQFSALARTDSHFRRFGERWEQDVATGNLPAYTFIFPRFLNSNEGRANDQHAPEDVRFGEHLIADVYDALAKNTTLFNQTALIVTYDEIGGFYDHIEPGSAPNPDGQDSPNPDDTATFEVPRFSFDRLGLRVPTVICSPWIPKGIVENRPLQHTSVIKTMSEMFGLAGPLNKRDANAASFADLFQQLNAPRTAASMPDKLPRPSLANPVVSAVAGIPVDPADKPLDSLGKEWLEGVIRLTAKSPALMAMAETAPVAPATQGEASELIKRRVRMAFGI